MLNAEQMAKEAGAARAMNMVVLGAGSPFIDIPYQQLQEGIRAVFGRKGDAVVTSNLNALEAGRQFALGQLKKD